MISYPGGKRFSAISGLVLDVNADVGVSQSGGYITGVADQSQSGNNLVPFTSSGYYAPTLVPNALNGKAAIVFSGGSSLGNASSISIPCLGPLHLFAVVKAQSSSWWANGGILFFAPYATSNVNGFGLIWSYSSGNGNYYGYDQVAGGNMDWFQNAQTPTIPHVVEMHISYGVNEKPVARVDGALQPFTAGTASNLSSGSGFTIGGYGLNEAAVRNFTGALRRLLVYNRELSNYEAGVVRRVLGLQNGIPVS
jgi:hypothetical protein